MMTLRKAKSRLHGIGLTLDKATFEFGESDDNGKRSNLLSDEEVQAIRAGIAAGLRVAIDVANGDYEGKDDIDAVVMAYSLASTAYYESVVKREGGEADE